MCTERMRRMAQGIRRRVLEHTLRRQGGYLSQACSSAEIFAALYSRILNLAPLPAPLTPGRFPGVPGPHNPAYATGAAYHGARGPALDRFYLSPSQYSLVLYAALIEAGRLAEQGLDEFDRDGGVVELIGAEHSPGMEVMSGSLGQGISQACGVALARQRRGETGRTVLFLSDGEFQIGQTWEAVQAAAFHGLGRVLVFVDINGYQCDGRTTEVMTIEPLDERLTAFGARVHRCDGHDLEALVRLGTQPCHPTQPTFVLCDTQPYTGLELLRERSGKYHYIRFGSPAEQARYVQAYQELGGPPLLPGEPSPPAPPPPGPVPLETRVHARHLVEWAATRPEVVVLSADLTSSTEIDGFRAAYPDRFLSMGIAEQNMVSFAGGLAREGYRPFVHTFGVFLYRRAFDQVAMSVAYPNLPVVLVGFLPGITTPGGATHQAIEDVAVLRALPNLTILECGDATDVEASLDLAYARRGPVYLRMLRGELPRLFPRSDPPVFGRARQLAEGGDVVVVSSGICTEEALRATAALARAGVGLSHFHVTTLKPFDDPAVRTAIRGSRYGVVTLENHTVVGGLGSIVAEQLATHGIDRPLLRLGLQDTFAHGASRRYLMRAHGLDALALVAAVERLIGQRYDITEEDLGQLRLPPRHSLARPEAL